MPTGKSEDEAEDVKDGVVKPIVTNLDQTDDSENDDSEGHEDSSEEE